MHKKFYQIGIKYKIIVLVSLLIGMAVAMISGIIAYRVQLLARDDANQIAEATAWHYAHIVKGVLQVPLDETRALAQLLSGMVNHSDAAQLSRAQVNTLLRHYIENSPAIVGMSVLFEPDAFDGKDREFVGQPGHDQSGRFIPYWSRDEAGHGVLEPLVDYASSEYYLLPKQTRREIITEPYVYPVQGKDVLMTTVVVPILKPPANGQFVGMVTMDIDLAELHKVVQNIKVGGFERAYTSLFSAQGTVVVSQNNAYTGKAVRDTTDSQALIDAVLQAQAQLIRRKSRTLGGATVTYVAPVQIGASEIAWSVVVNIPETEIMLGVNRVLWLLLFSGIGVVLVSAVCVAWLARLLTQPLQRVQTHLHALAAGTLLDTPLDYRADDEIGAIVGAYRQLKHGIQATIHQANAVAAGDYNQEVQLLSEQDQLGLALRSMTATLRQATADNATQDWLKTGQTRLAETLSGEQDIQALAAKVITFLAKYSHSHVGLIYQTIPAAHSDAKPYLQLLASYAYVRRNHLANRIEFGEGLVGQTALEAQPILLTQVPDEYIQIESGSGFCKPQEILTLPILYETHLKGVIELGSLKCFTPLHREFFAQILPAIGIAFHTAESRSQMQQLLTRLQQERPPTWGEEGDKHV